MHFCSKLTESLRLRAQPVAVAIPLCCDPPHLCLQLDTPLCPSMCQILSCLDSHVVHVYNNDFMLAIDLGFVSEYRHIWVVLSSGLQSAVLTFTAGSK